MSEPDLPVYDADGKRTRSYASALLRASGRVPDDLVDWDAFHARLAARAELSLARLRHPQVAARVSVLRGLPGSPGRRGTIPWWEHAARWSRLVVAGSIAAGIGLIMVVRASPKEAPDTVIASAAPNSEQTERQRAAFESVALGRGTSWSIESALLPSAAELLVPLGKGATTQ